MTTTEPTTPAAAGRRANRRAKAADRRERDTARAPIAPGRQDWSTWPRYDAAASGFPEWWYPIRWSTQLREDTPLAVTLLGQKIVLLRSQGTVRALHDRCPHRGVPLSQGSVEFPGTLSCAYHGWTFDAATGDLKAVVTDGPDSPICGKVRVRSYPTAERLGLVWVYIGEREPFDVDEALPEELRGATLVMGGRQGDRQGNWRLAAENGYDEGHAKYLHRTSLWRMFKAMPVWNLTSISREGRWIYRTQDEVHWDADFPGLGRWTNKRPWKINPQESQSFGLGNTGAGKPADPEIEGLGFPGFASIAYPGVLRIAYPTFIHYEFYVPIDDAWHRYVGIMVRFQHGTAAWRWIAKYLAVVRPFFHGNFSNQDRWMVELTDAPPEKLYRPDRSLIEWRKLCEEQAEEHGVLADAVGGPTFEQRAPGGTGGDPDSGRPS